MVSAIYNHLLGDRKFGLPHNLLATKVMPTIIPLTVAPGLSLEQVSLLSLEKQKLESVVTICNVGNSYAAIFSLIQVSFSLRSL